jgi:hypothetical protein
MKKIILLLTLGFLNTIHGILHIIQFLQSFFLATGNSHFHELIENPIFSVTMGIIGILSLVVGVRDFLHHRKCKN